MPKKHRESLTADFIRSVLDYNPSTGSFTWCHRPLSHFIHEPAMKTWNTRFAGRKAGSNHEGYWVIVINGIIHRAHRLAWLIMTGEWPQLEIDHIDRNRINNKWSNLRCASSSENQWNRSKNSNNTSGFKGVYWCKNVKKWRTKICVANRSIHVGLFNNKSDATLAYKKAAEYYHGDFRRVI